MFCRILYLYFEVRLYLFVFLGLLLDVCVCDLKAPSHLSISQMTAVGVLYLVDHLYCNYVCILVYLRFGVRAFLGPQLSSNLTDDC